MKSRVPPINIISRHKLLISVKIVNEVRFIAIASYILNSLWDFEKILNFEHTFPQSKRADDWVYRHEYCLVFGFYKFYCIYNRISKCYYDNIAHRKFGVDACWYRNLDIRTSKLRSANNFFFEKLMEVGSVFDWTQSQEMGDFSFIVYSLILSV